MLMGKSSLVNYVKTYNGRKQCLVSIYAFERFRNNKPYVQSALIDTLFTRGKPERMMEYLRLLDPRDIRYHAYYDGKEILLLVPLGTVVPSIRDEIDSYECELGSKLGITFSTRTWDLMLWPRTWNPKARKYVVEVTGKDKIEDLDDLASKSIKRINPNTKIIRSLYNES